MRGLTLARSDGKRRLILNDSDISQTFSSALQLLRFPKDLHLVISFQLSLPETLQFYHTLPLLFFSATSVYTLLPYLPSDKRGTDHPVLFTHKAPHVAFAQRYGHTYV